MSTPSKDEVLAQTRQWLEQAVIGLNLCPFAKTAYIKNQVRMVVSDAKHLDGFLDTLDAELVYLRDTPASEVETTLLVHPGLFADFLIFNDFLNVVDGVLEEHALVGEIQVVPFHPEFLFGGEAPEDMSHFTNRSPYPMLHLLREDSLTEAIDAFGDTEAIPERNKAALRELGLAGWQALTASKSL
ncbi:DUF1415 domain-containing protein [Burkholderiaceae bacterium]|nr:DUF1415 domain-containing protein [Burkholderiaceae bacterium]MDC0113425.1 DUF1415 domain-containing protein [Burkholderiaceae bacterium]MDO7552887.1 DUF1415 domain-containing protein [Burkholderiaceae bacterium]MDO7578964.1 DUF1415 domain-containing protein [Burkholderiaceae bacterium]MDO7595184.1 DUF1415 domain-containing protein [Burkholderiaceae bacterium]